MTPLPPGSTLGILGGGQLGKMIAVEAKRMGYRVAIMDPDPACSARQYADVFVKGAFGDAEAALELSSHADVITLETEHIPSESLVQVEAGKLLRPASSVLHTVQDRLRQKQFLEKHDFPAPAFAEVSDQQTLARAVEKVGAPSVLKTRRGGYDGKGQGRLRAPGDALAAWDSVGRQPCILEAFVPFVKEISVVLARALDGSIEHYPVVENVHRRGILHTTLAPANVDASVARSAQQLASDVATALGHVGVIAVEMFLLADDTLMVNEIAPRVHNSGHFTLGACATSQFEQHARAVLGLPLGDPALQQPAVMLNLLGDLWAKGAPDWNAVFAVPEARLHLYGKKEARPGRKMGHVTFTHAQTDEAMRLATDLYAKLARAAGLPPE